MYKGICVGLFINTLRLKESKMKEVKVFIDYIEGSGKSAVIFRAEMGQHVKEVVEEIPYISYMFPELRLKAQNTVLVNNLKLDKPGFKFIVYGNGLPLKTTVLHPDIVTGKQIGRAHV